MRESDDAFVRRVSEELRAPVRVSRGFDERVMAEVRARSGEQPALSRGPARSEGGATGRAPSARLAWLVRPRTLRVSPLGALALAAGFAGLALLVEQRPDAIPPGDVPGVAAGAPGANARLATRSTPGARRSVRFTLPAPDARTVALVADFNDWDAAAAPLLRGADGSWTLLVPLPPGRYEYAFVVDGARVVADPAAPRAAAPDFGAPNSVLTVSDASP